MLEFNKKTDGMMKEFDKETDGMMKEFDKEIYNSSPEETIEKAYHKVLNDMELLYYDIMRACNEANVNVDTKNIIESHLLNAMHKIHYQTNRMLRAYEWLYSYLSQ